MRRSLVCLLGLAALGCHSLWRPLNQYPPAYVRALETARAVLSRHFVVTNVDRAHGVVEASSVVRANLITKYRTKAVARVFPVGQDTYGAEIRVTNELEVSEVSSLGGGQPPHDWRAVGFDHLAETALMAELQAEFQGETIVARPRPSYIMFRPGAALPLGQPRPAHPSVPGPASVPPQPAAPTPGEAPAKSSAAPAPQRAEALFAQHLALGDMQWQRKDFERALMEYQRAALACPGNPIGHLSLAGVWAALRRYGAGAEALRAAAAAGGDQALDAQQVGRLRGPEDALGERLLLLKGWCKQRPEDLDGRLLLAYHYWLAGRTEEARASLGEIIQAKPEDAGARFLARQLEGARI